MGGTRVSWGTRARSWVASGVPMPLIHASSGGTAPRGGAKVWRNPRRMRRREPGLSRQGLRVLVVGHVAKDSGRSGSSWLEHDDGDGVRGAELAPFDGDALFVAECLQASKPELVGEVC